MPLSDELAREWMAAFAGVLESITGDPAEAEAAEQPTDAAWLWWEQRLIAGTRSIRFAVGIDAGTRRFIGEELLRAAGIEGQEDDALRQAAMDAIAQASSMAAGALGPDARCEGGCEVARPVRGSETTGVMLKWRGRTCSLALAIEPDPAKVVAATPNPLALDFLMDVELPVTISFGRAQMPLRDVLRLGTGSIVELNRGASDPVDIVVNNCVMASGEVVLLDGNYGVRITQVASRQERLKTMN